MKKINKSINPIIYFIAGSIITFAGTTFAAAQILASNVDFTPRDSSWNVNNAEAAINDLYYKVPGVPTGTILSIMGTTAPAGYLICDGSTYNISSHTNLAEYIKDQFGSYNYFGGDGVTTFKVPDLRGEFLRGTGTNSHANQGNGASVGVHQNGTKTAVVGTSYEGGRNYISFPNEQSVSAWNGYANADVVEGTGTNAWVSSAGSNSNARSVFVVSRPTNTSVLYIIKY